MKSSPASVGYSIICLTKDEIIKARQYEQIHKDCNNKVLLLAKQLREEWAKVGIHHTENTTSIAIARRLV